MTAGKVYLNLGTHRVLDIGRHEDPKHYIDCPGSEQNGEKDQGNYLFRDSFSPAAQIDRVAEDGDCDTYSESGYHEDTGTDDEHEQRQNTGSEHEFSPYWG
jgi:hypothetical protein